MHNRGCWDLERYTPDGLREHLDYAPKPHSSCTDWLTVRPLRGGENQNLKKKKNSGSCRQHIEPTQLFTPTTNSLHIRVYIIVTKLQFRDRKKCNW